VAGYQMKVQNDITLNKKAILKAIDWTAQENAEILLTPEGSLSGYRHEFNIDKLQGALEDVTNHAINRGVGLAVGTCFIEEDQKCYNQIRFYRPDGEYLGFHSKQLLCQNLDNPSEGEINYYSSSKLQIFSWRGRLKIGGLICNDMWANPICTQMDDCHLSQELSRMGAKIILHAVNGGRDSSKSTEINKQYHESNLRIRARSGHVWIITVDNCYPDYLSTSSPSGIINPAGDWVVRTESKGAEFFVGDIDVNIKTLV